jgi:hypothetical protein
MIPTLTLKLKTVNGDLSKLRVYIIQKEGTNTFININKLTLSKVEYKNVTILRKFDGYSLYLESITMKVNTLLEVIQFVDYIENKGRVIDFIKRINRNHKSTGDVN